MQNALTSPSAVKYANDRHQARITLILLVPAAIIACALIVTGVLAA